MIALTPIAITMPIEPDIAKGTLVSKGLLQCRDVQKYQRYAFPLPSAKEIQFQGYMRGIDKGSTTH